MAKDKRTSFRMTKGLLKRLKQYALDHEVSLATVIRVACETYLNKKSSGKNE
jgi:predicted DNA-binding protein